MSLHQLSEPRFVLGQPESDHVAIEFLRRTWPDAADYWEGNWITARITLHVGAFRGRYEASLRTTEVARFRVELERLQRSLLGEAKFESMEHWLSLTLKGDGRGHVEVSGEACDEPGMGNRLRFRLRDYDQTELPALLQQLAAMEAAFGVLGTP